MKFAFSFSCQVKERIVTFEKVGAVQLSSSFSCSPPTLCEESQHSRFYSMKRLFTTWCASFSCVPLKGFFFSVKAKKNCLVSFCLLSKRSASTLRAWYAVDCTYPCSFHQSLFPIQPAQLFFIKPPYLRYLSGESIKPLPVSLTFHTMRLNHPSSSCSRSSRNYRQLAELK